MSESIRKIDAKGLACPQPVVFAKKALEEGGFELLEITVDGASARENVSRFATHSGHAVESIRDAEGVSTIVIRRNPSAEGAAPEPRCEDEEATVPASRSAATVFISSDKLGSGNDELGSLLMRGFISALAEASPLPTRIILMNGGVRLAVEDSAALSGLAKLVGLGVEILACGTCLDFYKIKDKLAVGRVSNMFEISGLLLEGKTLSL